MVLYGNTMVKPPVLARTDVHHVPEHRKTQCFVGQNAHVQDHGFHLATHSLATCALNVTTTTTTITTTTTTPPLTTTTTTTTTTTITTPTTSSTSTSISIGTRIIFFIIIIIIMIMIILILSPKPWTPNPRNSLEDALEYKV